jgi:hypothetical protein
MRPMADTSLIEEQLDERGLLIAGYHRSISIDTLFSVPYWIRDV